MSSDNNFGLYLDPLELSLEDLSEFSLLYPRELCQKEIDDHGDLEYTVGTELTLLEYHLR